MDAQGSDFYTNQYMKMVDCINELSKQLLQIKIYFLLSFAALGLGYKTAIDLPLCVHQKSFIIFVISIIGNIIFWIIAEYIISHGFLYRYIQAKAAQVEKLFVDKHSLALILKLIKDPTEIKKLY